MTLSSENWRRPAAELSFLMQLLSHYMIEERDLLMRQRVRLSVIGSRAGLPAETLGNLDRTVELCSGNDGMRLCLAINYGSRGEIAAAARDLAREAAAGRLDPETIDEAAFAYADGLNGRPGFDLTRGVLPMTRAQILELFRTTNKDFMAQATRS